MSIKQIPLILIIVAAFFVSCPVSRAGTINYTYDVMGRLTQVQYEDGTVIQYTYDAMGNRQQQVITTGSQADVTPPVGTVTINSGKNDTNNASVSLTLTCTDTGSGCGQMQFSNDSSTWSAAEAYAATKTWTLAAGDGAKSVYVKFGDNAGNWSTPYSAGITLDTTAPSDGVLNATAGAGQVTLSWSGFSDATSGIAAYYLVYATDGFPATCTAGTLLYAGTNTAYIQTGTSSGTTYYYRVCAMDYAENMSSGVTANAAQPLPDKIGVFDGGYWYLDSNMSWAWDGTPTDTLGIFGIGLTGAVPVIGDWNGDGTTKIGVYMNGTWYLDMNRNWQWDGEPTDKMYTFGAGLPDAIPVVGNWDGNGPTRIGIYSDGVWYLDMNGNGQWDGEPTDKIAYFGAGLTGAVPVVGDWNGDGTTKIGIYQNGYWYLDINGNGQWDGEPTDQLGVFGIGLANAVPVVGDWNADGTDEIGIYQQGYWYLDKNRSWQWEGEPTDQFGVFGIGLEGAVPVPGKW